MWDGDSTGPTPTVKPGSTIMCRKVGGAKHCPSWVSCLRVGSCQGEWKAGLATAGAPPPPPSEPPRNSGSPRGGGPVPAPLPAGLPPPGPGGRCPLAATWPRPPPEPRPHAGACALASPSSRLDLVPAAQGRLTCAVRGAGRGSRAGQTRRPGTRRSVRRARGGGPACACARVETGGSRRGCGVPTGGPPCAGLRPGDPGPGQILGVTVRAWRPPRGHGRRPALSPLSGPRVRTGGGSEPSSRPPCCAGKTSGCGRRGVPTPGWVWPGQVHLLRPPAGAPGPAATRRAVLSAPPRGSRRPRCRCRCRCAVGAWGAEPPYLGEARPSAPETSCSAAKSHEGICHLPVRSFGCNVT